MGERWSVDVEEELSRRDQLDQGLLNRCRCSFNWLSGNLLSIPLWLTTLPGSPKFDSRINTFRDILHPQEQRTNTSSRQTTRVTIRLRCSCQSKASKNQTKDINLLELEVPRDCGYPRTFGKEQNARNILAPGESNLAPRELPFGPSAREGLMCVTAALQFHLHRGHQIPNANDDIGNIVRIDNGPSGSLFCFTHHQYTIE
jgi:hypothetical protein